MIKMILLKISLLLLLSIIMFSFMSCKEDDKEENLLTPVPTAQETYNIKYEVTGTGACIDASLTYYNSNFDEIQISKATLPWTYSFSKTDIIFSVLISASNNYDSGSITTKIYINNVLKRSNTSTEAYGHAQSYGVFGKSI